jgi:predicted alpha/beta hydrolase family esterase
MKTLGDNLNREGYRILTIDILNWNLHSIYKGAERLQSFLKKNDLHDLIIIGHSKGGLVLRKAIEDQETSKRINKLFTVCTPHHGTIYGYFRIVFLNELIPDGQLCIDLQKHSKDNSRIINIMPAFDNHIMPNRNAILENATNITLPIIGHTRILESKELAETILKYL